MPTQEKIEKVNRVKDYLSRSENYFITEYQGLDVETLSVLRTRLRQADARLLVEKNTLVRVAAHEIGVTALDDKLTGPTAIAFCFGDPVAPAKILYAMFKEKQLPVIKAFMMSGELLDGSKIGALADLPGRNDLLARVIGMIEAPIAEVTASLDAVTQEFIGTMEALAAARG